MTFSAPRKSLSNLVKRLTLATTLGVGALVLGPTREAAADDATVRIMTQNMYQGTNFDEILAATTPAQFVAAVTQTYQNILATNPPERAAAIAREIARARPALVALQEADILRKGVPPATTVVEDQLQALLKELYRLGQNYEAIAIIPGLDPEAPSTLGFDVRITYRTVIIARTDSDGGHVELSNMQVQHFLVNHVFSTAVGIPIVNTRGWASVDVTIREKSFRFVTTHLEAALPVTTQLAQAAELIQSAGNTSLPIVLVGDFNADAANSADPTFATYQLLLNAGFRDGWKALHPTLPGFTCCQAPNLLNPTSTTSHRIDLVLTRGPVSVNDIAVVGDRPFERTSSGLWPSDHAGLVASLRIAH